MCVYKAVHNLRNSPGAKDALFSIEDSIDNLI